jgi:hypothetical protein
MRFKANIFRGVGSVLNIWPSLPENPVGASSDAERLYSDWQRVAEDLCWAMGQMDKDLKKKRPVGK